MIAEFRERFLHLTENPPFPWQEALFARLVDGPSWPSSCSIPTGLGKTSVIAIWLLALAHHARANKLAGFPRRLVYVVNRRTVVDQATREAEELRKALLRPALADVVKELKRLCVRADGEALAISTLRGQFADNAEWRSDPSRPAVIVGTVDMIGSRLLFSGYGCGFKSRPLHAGFLGHGALLVHDEAHLESAFQRLLSAIEEEQEHCREQDRLRVMALTATSRDTDADRFGITQADREDPVAGKRIIAKKGIRFIPVEDDKRTAEKMAERALEHRDSGKAILVFARKLDSVEKITEKLEKARQQVQVLTGTMRGWERDRLADDNKVFARFLLKAKAAKEEGTVYLVCTSAGEVGVDLSADHMVCDLTPFDSMAQRLGRVNRVGAGDAHIDVVHVASGDKPKDSSEYNDRCDKTLALLQRLPLREDQRHDACPAALGDLPAEERSAAFTPGPEILPTSDILFDAWALTTIRGQLPGRPPVADWLHGVAEWEPQETQVAWREEVEVIATDSLLEKYKPEDLLADYPLKPQEVLRGRAESVLGHLKKLAGRSGETLVWLMASDGEVTYWKLAELVDKEDKLKGSMVLLPPKLGGLKGGLLDGDAEEAVDDVADVLTDPFGKPLRIRLWDDADEDGSTRGMRLVWTIDTRPEDDEGDEEEAPRRYWRWYVQPRAADDDGSRTAREPQELAVHLWDTRCFAADLVKKLGLSEPESSAITQAAWWHDQGKDRKIWQRSIGNTSYNKNRSDTVLAKSDGRKMRSLELNSYRHEFGSIIDVFERDDFKKTTPDMRDLVLHLIAAHHGRARPHFPEDEVFDPEHSEGVAAEFAREVPRRFARLQRKYGRWGLAYLESLVRAADALASQYPSPKGAGR